MNELFSSMIADASLHERLSKLATDDTAEGRRALSFMVSQYACSYNRRHPGRITLSPALTIRTAEALRNHYRSENEA